MAQTQPEDPGSPPTTTGSVVGDNVLLILIEESDLTEEQLSEIIDQVVEGSR